MEKGTNLKNTAAIFLAHLNPLTLSHEEIIRKLLEYYTVYIFPVRFFKNKKEVTTRSFPFSFEIRKQMILESFDYNEDIRIMENYTFFSPYIKYFFYKFKKSIIPFCSIVQNVIRVHKLRFRME